MAQVISSNNVGGIVVRHALLTVGLDPAVWTAANCKNCKWGIVPSKRSMRLVIADVLDEA